MFLISVGRIASSALSSPNWSSLSDCRMRILNRWVPIMAPTGPRKPNSRERQRVREEAYLNSLSGNYVHPEGGTRVGLTIEEDEASSYLSQNASNDNMIAFLTFWEKKTLRYKSSASIISIQLRERPWIIQFS